MTTTKSFCAVLFGASLMCFWSAGAQADPTTVSTISYNVAAGACSKPIAVPVNNKPVLLMGTSLNNAIQGVGSVTLLRGNTNNILTWAGVDYFAGTENSYSYNPAAHIMWLDFPGDVDVQTAASSHIQVCASASYPQPVVVGYLTFVY